jgi:stage III sporulation protein SpoIIIAA
LSSIPHAFLENEERRGLEYEITDNLEDLLRVLPPRLTERVLPLQSKAELGGLIEIVMDLGRSPEVRFQRDEIILTEFEVERADLEYVAGRIGHFGEDNRAGIERTLHRISAIRNRTGEIVGLTCRIGRAVYGTIAIISDLIESGQSILLLGRPGVGKTTMLRETARVLADELRKRVVVVDTSNEIAGDGDIPHPAIGRARRMQVPSPALQHAVMIEAAENHMPEVVVIDEIGTELEAMAARTIAERGVQLIGTAHGNSLENLMLNPTLSDLIGGIQTVTLSDEEARRRGTQKSILERKAPPTFNVMVEIVDRDEVAVHLDVAATVDALLRGAPIRSELRRREADGSITTSRIDEARRDPNSMGRVATGAQANGHRNGDGGHRDILDFQSRQQRRVQNEPHQPPAPEAAAAPEPEVEAPLAPVLPRGRGTADKPVRVFPFGISRNRLEQSIGRFGVPAIIVRDGRDADIVITLKNYFRQKPQPIRDAEAHGTPVYVLRSNTGTQMEHVLQSIFPNAAPPNPVREQTAVQLVRGGSGRPDPVVSALAEAEDAISAVMEGAPPIALAPQASPVRRMQHELADRYSVSSRSRGREPHRHVEVYRRGMQ